MRASLEAEYTEYVQARLGWLRRTAYLLCQDWQGADDLAQKAITRLYTHWGRAGKAASLDAYVRGILVKAFLDERRSAWARRVTLPGDYENVRRPATTPTWGWMSVPRCGRCRRASGPPSCSATTATAPSRRRPKSSA